MRKIRKFPEYRISEGKTVNTIFAVFQYFCNYGRIKKRKFYIKEIKRAENFYSAITATTLLFSALPLAVLFEAIG